MSDQDDDGSRSILSSSAVMAAGTVVSRASGFVRNALLAAALGTQLHADVFTIANTVPAGVRDVVSRRLAAIDPALTPAVRSVLTAEGSVASRNGRGGTAPVRVSEQLSELDAVIGTQRRNSLRARPMPRRFAPGSTARVWSDDALSETARAGDPFPPRGSSGRGPARAAAEGPPVRPERTDRRRTRPSAALARRPVRREGTGSGPPDSPAPRHRRGDGSAGGGGLADL